MNAIVLAKLLAMFAAIGAAWALARVADRRRWLARWGGIEALSRWLGSAAFVVFVPALLFRTMARVDFAHLPLAPLLAYFVPLVAFAIAVWSWQRRRGAAGAEPATRAVAASYGNAVQMGIPVAAALFGETGLALHLTIVSLHGLTLLTVLTALVENDLARGKAAASRWATLARTVRNTVIHPVVPPVLAGLAWNLGGWALPAWLDQLLQLLGAAVAPLCLALLGLSLAIYGLQGQWRAALPVVALKLLVLPLLVFAVARWGFGLTGMPLAVLVMMAALPVGANALIFAQRYRTLQGEATAGIVVSTMLYAPLALIWPLVVIR